MGACTGTSALDDGVGEVCGNWKPKGNAKFMVTKKTSRDWVGRVDGRFDVHEGGNNEAGNKDGIRATNSEVNVKVGAAAFSHRTYGALIIRMDDDT